MTNFVSCWFCWDFVREALEKKKKKKKKKIVRIPAKSTGYNIAKKKRHLELVEFLIQQEGLNLNSPQEAYFSIIIFIRLF